MISSKIPGLEDGHSHADRGDTTRDEYFEHADLSLSDIYAMSLPAKQDVVGILHSGKAYERDELTRRMRKLFEIKRRAGETGIWTPLDTSPDIGLRALEVATELRVEFAAKNYAIHRGGYPIFGLCSGDSLERLELLESACEAGLCDHLVGLPERDARAGHELIGRVMHCQDSFYGHVKAMCQLGCKYNLQVQFHVDQQNSPFENGSELVLNALRVLEQPKVDGWNGPTVWLVHCVSTSCYNEVRFRNFVSDLKRFNVGVIVCPQAAISMRQLRCFDAPVHNSIARVLELAVAGVPIRFGTDNINDVFVPIENPYMQREIEQAANACRFYLQPIWEKLANGITLSNSDKDRIGRVIAQDEEVCHAALAAHPR